MIVLIQRVSDPRKIEQAFSSLGVPLSQDHPAGSLASDDLSRFAEPDQTSVIDERDSKPTTSERTGESSQRADARPTSPLDVTSEASKWTTTCHELVPRLLEAASAEELSAIGELWFTAPSAPANAVLSTQAIELGACKEKTLKMLREFAKPSQPRIDDNSQSTAKAAAENSWADALQHLGVQWELAWNRLGVPANPDDLPAQANQLAQPNSQFAPVDTIDKIFESTFTNALDQRLMKLLRDAAPWQKNEFVPFWRLLQRAGDGSANLAREATTTETPQALPPFVSTLQLEAETPRLRGTPVRYRGTIRRVDYVERNNERLGVTGGYWQVWIRGEDHSAIPIAVFTRDKHAKDWQAALTQTPGRFPNAIALGIVAKRLAYASPDGLQVAPTLFAQRMEVSLPSPPLASTKPTPNSRELAWQLAGMLVISALVAIAVVFPVFRNAKIRVRGRKQPSRGESPPLKASPRDANESTSSSATKLTWLLAGCLASSSANQLLAQTEQKQAEPTKSSSVDAPPWREPSQAEQLRSVVKEFAEREFTAAVRQQLAAQLHASERSGVPEPLLKLMALADKLNWPMTALGAQPATPLGNGVRAVTYRGYVRLATREQLTETQLAWLPFDTLVRLEIQLDITTGAAPTDAKKTAPLLTVFCTRAPQAWLTSPNLKQPVTVSGLAIEDISASSDITLSTAARPGVLPLCILADHASWTFTADEFTRDDSSSSKVRSQLQPAIRDDLWQLGRVGWDLSNIDVIRAHHQRAMSSDEREGLLSLIRLAPQVGKDLQDNFTARPEAGEEKIGPPPVELFRNAKDEVGTYVRWPVRLVVGTVVEVDGRDLGLLGSDRYYQLDGFLDLQGQTIRYQAGQDTPAAQTLEFEGEFPITLVMRSVPPEFTEGQKRVKSGLSWNIGRTALVEGTFFRMWSYSNERLGLESQARQAAPLVVVTNLSPYVREVTPIVTGAAWVGVLLCVALLACLGAIWFWALADSRVSFRRRNRK